MKINKQNIISKKGGMSYIQILILIVSTFAFSFLIYSPEQVSAQKADYCCEKTTYGAWCQNSPEEKCQTGGGLRKVPTSCDATSYCKPGCCYEAKEGLCMENTPQKVCNDKNGTWFDNSECAIPQCELGCCVLDNQAAFVTLARCKRLSALYGLLTDFRTGIGNEMECIALTQTKDRGACVYEEQFTKTCKFTTREECLNIKSTGNMSKPDFYKDYLCSNEELATNCGRSSETTCVEGKDEVYFKDTCGNPSNIYDASRKDEPDYWNKVIDKAGSCNYGKDSANSVSCGNCDYYLGSICKKAERGKSATYGNYICKDLNCYKTSDGKNHKHGESWCSYDGATGKGIDAVGSRHVRHLCVGGEEIVEPCQDLRQETCIEGKTETTSGVFQEAACRVNRWRDCVGQGEKDDCENTDKRDCFWIEGVSFTKTAEANTGESGGVNGMTTGGGACVPDVPPGLKFWTEGETEGICKVASAQCEVTYEKGLLGSKKPVENKECLEESWAIKMNQVCSALGDCGADVNYVGKFTQDGADWKIDDEKQTLSQAIANSIRSSAGIKTTGRVLDTGNAGVNAFVVAVAKGISWVIAGSVVSGQDPVDIAGEMGGGASGEVGSVELLPAPEPDLASRLTLQQQSNLAELKAGRNPSGLLTESATSAPVTAAVQSITPGSTALLPGGQFGTTGALANDMIPVTVTTAGGGSTTTLYSVSEVQGMLGTRTPLPKAVSFKGSTVTDLFQSGDKYTAITQSGNNLQITKTEFRNLGGKVGGAAGGKPGTTWLSQLFGLPTRGGLDALVSGLEYAGIGYLLGQIIGSIAGLDKKQTEALSAALAGGLGTWKALSTWSEAGWLGTHAALVGIGVGVGIFLLMYKKESKEIVTFSCMPWQAPVGKVAKNDCEICNKKEGCSEYRCKSLGQACQLLNAGKTDEKCTWVNPKDTSSPVITTWEEVLTKGHKYSPDNTIRPPARGVKILRTGAADSCIKAFTPLEFGINVNEPAQCKIDYNHTLKFDNMAFWFGESDLYLYNHSQKMSLPSPSAVEKAAPELKHNGTYTLYVRCQDANGNENVDEFAIRFCVEKGPDTTPPKIEGTSIANNMPVQYNKDSVELEVYVNEPANCKWSREDRDYNTMETEMTCNENVWEMNNNLVYTCKTNLTGIKNRQDNVFYFRCKDKPGANESERYPNQESYKFTLKGTETLNIIDIKPNGTIKGSTDVVSVWLEVETANGYKNGEAICYYSDTQNEADYIEFRNTSTNLHKQRLDLIAGSYKYYVKCVDLGGNRDDNSTEFTVEVDKSAPVIARVYQENELLKIVTTEDSECRYDIKSCNFKFEDGVDMPYANQTSHFAEWKTENTYYIRCSDKYGNIPLSNQCSMIVRPYDIVEQKAEE